MPSEWTALDVAHYFIRTAADQCDSIDHLKLQHLLYRAQGYALAISGKPLFDEPICAAADGELVASVARIYRERGPQPIPGDTTADPDVFHAAARQLLEAVYGEVRECNGSELSDLAAFDSAWQAASRNEGEIDRETLRRVFETQIIGHDGPLRAPDPDRLRRLIVATPDLEDKIKRSEADFAAGRYSSWPSWR